ncbi:D-alanine--D-alanine ligase [Prochlorococcus marinus str. MIT 9515]|uniref:D-alanine--D-alanine ligase n=1 Tax=Prochlorococcus marinus (strain MIT 9515) TaxID=167542 RepID=DDL_PROM5|nr:D-alanine--D-alanine ligase family protein [Prochlorococcus marinus]A2BY13.1 RecName: Full=D-alanine--D-alanine ligase; AltName: Full=D-Ala-D-Ala ligase; AltName: Full=D-alanylalanine synthetase [Prochlorococcus marinus str. MIT 9515]ABM72674.1 D-alanine--D-alanine ligase [Prochlorococcus marinus str. MIT 9515]
MVRNEKKCIGIIFGGTSNEHYVSISSAKTVFKALISRTNKELFRIKAFYINKHGVWIDSDLSLEILRENSGNNIFEKYQELPNRKINFLNNLEFQNIDIWFPLLHGCNGEDGAIHGLLKFTQKPLIGCGISGSAIGMDKILMKQIFSNLSIPQVNFLAIQNYDLSDDNVKDNLSVEIIEKLNLPVFVKPANSGSSLGISKAKNKSEIIKALQKAWEIDSRIVIEEGLNVRELECGIIGNLKLSTSKIGEVSYSSDWYDYDSKYSTDNKIIIPADIDSQISEQIKDLAIRSCRALNIYGFARVDFFLEKISRKIFLNEINTIPGFTSKSMFPMLWKASGLNIDQLVAKLIDISLDS